MTLDVGGALTELPGPGVAPTFAIHGRGDPGLAVVAAAIHAGHDLRPDLVPKMRLTDPERCREEDPGTERIALAAPTAVVVHRSRFEVDLNRAREASVYDGPGAAWGLEVWNEELDDQSIECSRSEHDDFYAAMRQLLDPLAAARPFVVLDVHSYNHRREGPDAPPAAPAENPEVNVGTGSLDRHRWGPLVDRFLDDLGDVRVAGHRLDVRENVRFRGGQLAAWVHERYAGVGCALALEFKKTFMDEWTGEIDHEHLDQLAAATATTFVGLQKTLDGSR